MKIAIIDDEKRWRDEVSKQLLKLYKINISELNVYKSGAEFLASHKEYDLVFMDIEMPELDGFETAIQYREIVPQAILIILTTHTELSRKGYLINAFRYIDKCKLEEELMEALTSAQKLLDRNQSITVNVVNLGEICLRLTEILYIETEKRNVLIHTKNANYISNQSMSELEQKLDSFGFFRSHKSYLVNLDKIKNFDRQNIYFQNEDQAMVSIRKYTELKKRYLERRFEYANM